MARQKSQQQANAVTLQAGDSRRARRKRTNPASAAHPARRLTKEQIEQIKWSDVEPLYALWRQYFRDLVGCGKPLGSGFDDPDKKERLLRADLHGALVQVADADNPTQVGATGIVALESRNTFQLVTKQDRYLKIPKQGTALQFALDGRVWTVFGDALRGRASQRARRVRKGRRALPFLVK